MPIPPFRDDGWLPAGHHPATWEEIEETFGGLPGNQRDRVLSNLIRWRDAVRSKGLSGLVVLNGSFISNKAAPGDFDCIFVYDAAAVDLLKNDLEAQALISYSQCKVNWRGDIFTFEETTQRRFPSMCTLNMFDLEKTTGTPKGVVEVRI